MPKTAKYRVSHFLLQYKGQLPELPSSNLEPSSFEDNLVMSDVCPNCRPVSFNFSDPFSVQLGACIAFDTPTPARHGVLSAVQDIEQAITSCRERMSRLTAVLADAQRQLDSLEELRRAHIRLFPPIHTLPVEVLLVIFELAVKKPYHFSSIQDSPWGLGHVCHSWRQITSSPSSLWSSPYCNSYSTKAMLSTVLERSLPLAFHYDINYKRKFTDIVKRHSLRWHKVILSGSTADLLQLEDVGPLPLLTAVTLSISRPEIKSFAEILHPFQSAPKLQSLKLIICSHAESLTPLPSAFPWHQLTHLEHSSRWSSFLLDCQLLSCCPLLQSYVSHSREEPGPSETVLHPKLTFLGVKHVALLQYLQCASLIELKLDDLTLEREDLDAIQSRYVSPLRTFLWHSPLLTSISMHAALGSGRVCPLLSTFTSASIQKLTLEINIEGAKYDIEPLVASATPLLLPNLIDFGCTSGGRPVYVQNTSGFDQSLCNVIQSRWRAGGKGVAQLKRVRLSFKSGYCTMAADARQRIIDGFRALKEEGLDIEVLWGNKESRQQLL